MIIDEAQQSMYSVQKVTLFYTESLTDDERFMQVLKRIFIFLAFKKILPCLRLYENYLVEVMVIRGKCNAFFSFLYTVQLLVHFDRALLHLPDCCKLLIVYTHCSCILNCWINKVKRVCVFSARGKA